MDPLSAVGLAGTIIQFITFACSLLSKSSEIHNSVTGRSTDLTSIITVYEKLQAFSTQLTSQENAASRLASSNEIESGHETSALKEILKASKTDCDQLLKVAQKLDVENGPFRRWKSFRAALELLWKRDEIEELDKRLQRTQSALTLHICALMSHFHESNYAELTKLRATCDLYQIKQEEKIDNIIEILRTIEGRYFPPKLGSNGDKVAPEHISLVKPQDIDDLEQQMAELSLIATSISRQQSVLVSLNFEHRPLRHDRIPTAHKQTFGWIYHDYTERLESKCQLLKWLKTGCGIFWVSGKPGSGKSTFMKYLADNERTQQALDDWARPQKALTASHYFWNAGTAMQKSQQGLLQELLLKIFRQRPELIENTCTERFSRLSTMNQLQATWSTAELRCVLRRVAESDLSDKICLFIDGLDEYVGDHFELCQNLDQLVRAGNIKLCVSSRPWNVFEDAFGGRPSKTLRIHELTESDILAYVESRLSEHPRWINLLDQPHSGACLVGEVTKRSHGVFLWVFLVTKLLREGLTNDDSFADLLSRLEQLPSELEPFFKHMLDSVEPFYHHKMSGSLQIAVASKKPLRYPLYSYLEDEYSDQHYALKLKPRQGTIQPQELELLHHKVARRLDGHCKGLLEVGCSYVNFIHRTVADFLQTREMADYLIEKGLPTFNAKLAILRATLAFIKDTAKTIAERLAVRYAVGDGLMEVHTQVKDAIWLASQLEEESPALCDTVEDILDDLELSLCKLNSKNPQLIIPQIEQSGSGAAKAYFRANLIKSGVEGFLKKKIAQEPDYLCEFDGPPLTICAHLETQEMMKVRSRAYNKVNGTLKLLLEEGEDPNERYTDTPTCPGTIEWTPWAFYLSQVITATESIGYCCLPQMDDSTFLIYLEHGADPNARIFRSIRAGASNFSTAWVDFLLLSLSMKPGWMSENAYIRVLDAFLDGDINIRDPAFIITSGKTQYVHDAFFSGLKQQTTAPKNAQSVHNVQLPTASGFESDTDDSIIAPRQLRLLRTVTLKLLIRAHGHSWPMDGIWSTISEVFGARQQKLMLARYASSCADKSVGTSKGVNKRGVEDADSDRRASKLSRTN
ncbi:hypothetical protein F5Y19DRAFT_229962 [Xylariaceae sp. FL1651]|nr:hypothetical protein F5Y19DRAFT_229962 [Xylariaceae sp. FL1651]